MKTQISGSILNQRRAGVLLHPSSLPGKQRLGDIGQEARNFLHFMADCGLSVWQMLPLGPTHYDGSPYQCLSSHAGNPELINLQWLVERGWLESSELVDLHQLNTLPGLLTLACQRFFKQADHGWLLQFEVFIEQHRDWLADFSLYMALKNVHQNRAWTEWPLCYRFREAEALSAAEKEHADFIKMTQFSQFVFFTQWHELKQYADRLNIKLFGDMPIYVSMDSADIWAHKENFLIGKDGRCGHVAGVPPDAFSDEGQLWGNPLYNWQYLEQNRFEWWIQRFRTQLELFDFIRIDHFRGLEACWQIPAQAKSAIEGEWVKTPGKALLYQLQELFDPIALVAEDLGFITKEVLQLRDQFNLPGMAVLQFAFDGQYDNHYLPHNCRQNQVIYTGTHDNDTTLGWYQNLPEYARKHLHDYLGQSENLALDIPWALNRMALSSVANLAILPMQDLLALDSSHRMNTPGTTEGNWQWRFNWDQVWPSLAIDLYRMNDLYGRLSQQTTTV